MQSVRAVFLVPFLACCGRDSESTFAAPTVDATTPEYGIPVKLPQGFPDADRAPALAAIDSWFKRWRTDYMTRVTDVEHLNLVARIHPVHVYEGTQVPGDDPTYGYGGFCWYGSRIEVAMYPLKDGLPFPWLYHEWEHGLLGDFHPRTSDR